MALFQNIFHLFQHIIPPFLVTNSLFQEYKNLWPKVVVFFTAKHDLSETPFSCIHNKTTLYFQVLPEINSLLKRFQLRRNPPPQLYLLKCLLVTLNSFCPSFMPICFMLGIVYCHIFMNIVLFCCF